MEPVIVVGDDRVSKEAVKALARHNITVLAAGLAAGMSVDAASQLCIPLPERGPKVRELTAEDHSRIAAAEAKRQRRAAKRGRISEVQP